MQQDKIFKRGWMGIGSAVVGTIMCLMMIGVFIYTIYVYINSGEINNYIEEGTNMADIWREMILGTILVNSPMAIGAILNWIGAIRKMRPLILIAGIFYLLSIIFGTMFLLCAIFPSIMCFIAFYQMGHPQTPTIRPPRLR